MSRTGQCLCGAVKFTADRLGNFGVCHCTMCQRWSGSALFGVTVPEASMRIEDPDQAIAGRRSSDWATRYWCRACGSGLWYRHDKGLDGTGDYEVALGLFDDQNGLTLKREINIDLPPDSWALQGEHEKLTEAQTIALFG